MSTAGLIFFGIFALPLILFLIWVMRQDKQKGLLGLVILGVAVIAAIAAALFVYSNLTSKV
ncbi:MAG TPA: hypothetical protein VNI52_08880 [Sphingobacteriaceae bacterium]|nr:hypothetical protein [Sphingobacteriaceae bacterium]